jgi:cellulose synthase/poly-beta-1,6-N-acetylglucosamine synthase-like glycosyltransferase
MIGLARWNGGASPNTARDDEYHPSVSIIIATREAELEVSTKVKDLARVRYPPSQLEIVVADDRGGSQSYRLPTRAGGVRVMVVRAGREGGKAEALNAAVRVATGEILAFADTHQRWETDALEQLIGPLRHEEIAAVSGQLELPSSTGPLLGFYWAWERKLRLAEARIHSSVGVSGSIWAMRRTAWEDLPAGLLLDDLYTPLRLVLDGHRVVMTPEAKAFESRVGDPVREYRRKVRTLTGNFQLLAWLPGVLVPFRNPIWVQFIGHKLLRLLTPYAGAAFLIGAFLTLGSAATSAIIPMAGAAGVITVWLLLAPDRLARRIRSGLRWALVMQAAVVHATVNGLRGRWDVWR